MIFTVKEVRSVINQEIKQHNKMHRENKKSGKPMVTDDFHKGFIAGLKQARDYDLPLIGKNMDEK